LKTKPRKIINGNNFTLEILDMGSLELNIERRKTLNCGTLNGGVTVRPLYGHLLLNIVFLSAIDEHQCHGDM
jgi:hypothetical protein